MSDYITVVEVGPRDGLQNEAKRLPTAAKVSLIEALADAGLKVIEAGAFVSPKWIPQMADSGEVLRSLHRHAGVRYPVLVPNLQGYEAARAAGADEVAVFAAASEAFTQKNINCTIAQSLDRFRPVCVRARTERVVVRGYISCALGCPYEGDVAIDRVVAIAEELADIGCSEISLGDTIGVGTASKTRDVLRAITASLPLDQIAVHFHDTYGMAKANIIAALEEGVRIVDASVGRLGGCPYAKGAPGNVGTEDVVLLLDELGLSSGINLDRLVEIGVLVSESLGRAYDHSRTN